MPPYWLKTWTRRDLIGGVSLYGLLMGLSLLRAAGWV